MHPHLFDSAPFGDSGRQPSLPPNVLLLLVIGLLLTTTVAAAHWVASLLGMSEDQFGLAILFTFVAVVIDKILVIDRRTRRMTKQITELANLIRRLFRDRWGR